jgi:fatty-acid desaturase
MFLPYYIGLVELLALAHVTTVVNGVMKVWGYPNYPTGVVDDVKGCCLLFKHRLRLKHSSHMFEFLAR